MKRIIVAILLVLTLFSASGCDRSYASIKIYDKEIILRQYGADIDSALFLFPDNTEAFVESSLASKLYTGLFDTDGFIILKAKYLEDDYKEEKERLSAVSCTVSGSTINARYDTESYALPAYIASDGFDYVYEYALTDDASLEIVYVLLSNPESIDLGEYKKYLKTDRSEYEISDALREFSIYAREDEHGNYLEYSDEHGFGG